MDQSNEQQISGTSYAAEDNETPPQIFKLRVDIFDTIFDYMPLEDILAMSQTCKTMQKVAGSYFQQNFLDMITAMGDVENPKTIYINGMDTLRDGFEEFISSLHISLPVRNVLNAESFSSLKHLKLFGQFDGVQLHNVENILSNVEILDLREMFRINDELYEQLLNNCTKLKELRLFYTTLRQNEIIHNWLQTNHTLEKIDFGKFEESRESNQLKILLEGNSSLKHVKIDGKSFWDNRNIFAVANIQLDCLILHCWHNLTQNSQFADLLIELNARGVFKKLVLHMGECSQEFINQVASISTLENMFLFHLIPNLNLSPLVHLKVLHTIHLKATLNMDMNILARNLVNLETIYVVYAIIEDIIPFLRNSRKLNVVKVQSFQDNIIDIAALNQLRKNLNGGRKVSIYVGEGIYLATKWATKNEEFSLVKIKRADSHKFGFDSEILG